MGAVEITVELGKEFMPGQRFASLAIGGCTVFSDLVYDNKESPAERNITFLFADRLRGLLEES